MLAVGAAIGLLGFVLGHSDLPGAARALRGAGPALAFAVLPWLCAMSLDTLGWRAVFGFLGPRPPFWKLLRVRLSAEAVTVTLPGGAVVAESLVPVLLSRAAGVGIPRSVAAIAGRKWLQTRAQVVYLASSALLGWGTLARVSPALVGGGALPWLVLASALLPLAASLLVQALFGGAPMVRLSSFLSRLHPRAKAWLARRREALSSADRELQQLADPPRAPLAWAHLAWIAAWFCESAETWLLLRLVGAEVAPVTALSFEAALSLVRSLAFFAPGGLGVQDAGYLLALRALGVPHSEAVGAAFVLLKRGKEVFWAAVGWVLLLVGAATSRGAAGPAPEEPGA